MRKCPIRHHANRVPLSMRTSESGHSKNRPELIGAVATLVNSWISAGKPKPENINCHLGGFEQYVEIMGGILEHNGITGFLDNRDDFRKVSDEEGFVLSDLVAAWKDSYGTKEITSTQLLKVIDSYNVSLNLGEGNERSRLIRLGNFLGSMGRPTH